MLDKENASKRSRSLAGVGLLGRALKTRRLARCSVAVLLLGLLAAATYVYLVDHYEDVAYGQGNPIDPPLPEPGSARPWEIEIGVSTYSTWHSRHGNTLTRIPIVTLSGQGPTLSMWLFHNAASVDASFDIMAGMGFSLGPGWTVPCSSQLRLDDPQNPSTVTVVADDGTQTVYTWSGTDWVAPPGVYDVLTRDGNTWRLTHKDQSYHEYQRVGELAEWARLEKIVDAAGNALRLERDVYGKIAHIYGAGRVIDFIYTPGTNRLVEIKDPRDEADPPEPGEIEDRIWQFTYDAQDRIDKIIDPMGFRIEMGYDTDGRIETISDKKESTGTGDVYTYTYDEVGHLLHVLDPEPRPGASNPQLSQSFDLTATDTGPIKGLYTDRRGNTWTYEYAQAGFPDGNLSAIVNPLDERTSFHFDANRNLERSYYVPDEEWTFTYDDHGNLQTSTDPLQHMQQWQYDEYNNVTSYTDALGNTLEFRYEYTEDGYPTLLTKIIEPPVEPGGDPGITALDYYLEFDSNRCFTSLDVCGRVKEVIDPNGVWTGFEYDQWGQLGLYAEGLRQGGGGGRGSLSCSDDYVYCESQENDSAGRPSEGSSPTTCVLLAYSGLSNWPIAITCDDCGDPVRGGGQQAAPGAPSLPTGPTLPSYEGDWSVPSPPNDYSPKGELLRAVVDGKLMDGESQVDSYTRTYTNQYDELGQLTAGSISAPDEWGGNSRGFTYDHNLADGTYTRIGPDGVETFVELDAANRVAWFRRGPEANPIMTASYCYTEVENGLLDHVTYGNGTKTVYTYDAARRLVAIDHQNPLGQTVLKLAYAYTINDLVASITETGSLGWRAAVKFTYDSRGRLIREARYDVDPARDYHISYEYDQGGNRTRKIRSLGGCNRIETVYHYDYEDPYSGSYNNRLMYYETYETCRVFEDYGHTGGCGTEELVSTTWYYYNDAGNVTHVVKQNAPPEEPAYEATRLEYARNGRAVTYVLGETWDEGPANYDITYAREFRYDSARQRYMNRALDPDALEGGSRVPLSTVWSDYDRDGVYGDFEIDGQTITELRSFELGLAKVDPWTTVGGADTSYYHTDMIGTTRFMTDSIGDDIESAPYTAFGERVSGTQHRYGYAGAWGYQAHGDSPFLHVGHRYYDPATGRFVERDPIGIRGGRNVFAYARNAPTLHVDPDGLWIGAALRVAAKLLIKCGKWVAKKVKKAPKKKPPKKKPPKKEPEPYPVRPPEPPDPEVPRPIWPKDPPPPVRPSPPIEPGPPYYDPDEPWPT